MALKEIGNSVAVKEIDNDGVSSKMSDNGGETLKKINGGGVASKKTNDGGNTDEEKIKDGDMAIAVSVWVYVCVRETRTMRVQAQFVVD